VVYQHSGEDSSGAGSDWAAGERESGLTQRRCTIMIGCLEENPWRPRATIMQSCDKLALEVRVFG
jgi:hypothetical protein